MAFKETPIKFTRGPSKKKYKVWLKSKINGKIRTLTFGHKNYQQFKDSVPKRLGGGLYSHLNHSTPQRRFKYFSRHSAGIGTKSKAVSYEMKKSKGLYTPKLLSHIYLW